MSDPRGWPGAHIDALMKKGLLRKILESNAQTAHGGGAEANIYSGVVPADTLKNVGDTLIVRARGSFAANANAKRVRALLGAGVLVDSVSSTSWNAHKWELQAVVSLTTAPNAQKAIGSLLGITAAGAAAVLGTMNAPTTPAEDCSTDLTLTIKGTGVAGSDVVCEQVEVFAAGKVG